MKSTAVDENLSTMNKQFCSREKQLLQLLKQNEKSTQISKGYLPVPVLSLSKLEEILDMVLKAIKN